MVEAEAVAKFFKKIKAKAMEIAYTNQDGAGNPDFKAIFRQFDTSGDGVLSKEEFAGALLALGLEVTPEQIKAIVRFVDHRGGRGGGGGDGIIRYDEFIQAFFNHKKFAKIFSTGKMTYERKVALSHSFDKKNDGHLNKSEFGKYLKSVGVECSSQDIDLIFYKFDKDHRGSLSVKEFVAFMNEEIEKYHEEEDPLPKCDDE